MSEHPAGPTRALGDIFAPIAGQPNSCTHGEYLAVAEHVRRLAPCRFLVFGVGRDSAAWSEVNAGGQTLFLENNPEWVDRIGNAIDATSIRLVRYQQSYEEWEAAGLSGEEVPLPELSDPPFDHSWQIVFVDGPWGPTYGRHQSAHAAARAVVPGGLVALHDCDREREQTICRLILEARGFVLENEVERLRLYRAPS